MISYLNNKKYNEYLIQSHDLYNYIIMLNRTNKLISMYYKSNLSIIEKNKTNSLDSKLNICMKPMELMRRLCKDYNKTKLYTTADHKYKYKGYKHNHAERMTKFIKNYQQSLQMNQITPSSVPVIPNQNKFRMLTQQKYKISNSQQTKRCYFKNSYANIHPFLLTHHNIKQKIVTLPTHAKTQSTQYINSAMYNNQKLMTPQQNRKTIQQLKQAMMRMKYEKKQITDKVRYNYLINNAFRGQKRQCATTNVIVGARAKFMKVNTQERIFPPTVPVNNKIVQNIVI